MLDLCFIHGIHQCKGCPKNMLMHSNRSPGQRAIWEQCLIDHHGFELRNNAFRAEKGTISSANTELRNNASNAIHQAACHKLGGL